MTNGKQRIREILEDKFGVANIGINKERTDSFVYKKPHPKTEEALDSIEEIMKEVLGENEVFVDIPIVDAFGRTTKVIKGESFAPYMIPRNSLRSEQLGRWESK